MDKAERDQTRILVARDPNEDWNGVLLIELIDQLESALARVSDLEVQLREARQAREDEYADICKAIQPTPGELVTEAARRLRLTAALVERANCAAHSWAYRAGLLMANTVRHEQDAQISALQVRVYQLEAERDAWQAEAELQMAQKRERFVGEVEMERAAFERGRAAGIGEASAAVGSVVAAALADATDPSEVVEPGDDCTCPSLFDERADCPYHNGLV
jgi:hypothetical protein